MLKATVYSSLDCHKRNILIQAPSTHFSYYKILYVPSGSTNQQHCVHIP